MSKSQIDKIGARLRSGDVNAGVLRDLENFRTQFAESYAHVEHVLVDQLGFRVTGRPSKSTVAIIEKLRRESIRLTQVQDIAGCRIVVEDVAAQNAVFESASIMLGQLTVIDRRAKPINGYRALHLVAKVQGMPVEIQVRTRLQHAWSEISEKISDIYGQEIKYGKGEKWALEFLSKLSRLTAEREELQARHRALLASAPSKPKKGSGAPSQKKMLDALAYSDRLNMYEIRQLFSQLNNR